MNLIINKKWHWGVSFILPSIVIDRALNAVWIVWNRSNWLITIIRHRFPTLNLDFRLRITKFMQNWTQSNFPQLLSDPNAMSQQSTKIKSNINRDFLRCSIVLRRTFNQNHRMNEAFASKTLCVQPISNKITLISVPPAIKLIRRKFSVVGGQRRRPNKSKHICCCVFAGGRLQMDDATQENPSVRPWKDNYCGLDHIWWCHSLNNNYYCGRTIVQIE